MIMYENMKDRMIQRGESTAMLDVLEEIFDKPTRNRLVCAWSPIIGGYIFDVEAPTLRHLIDYGFKPCIELQQTRYINSIVYLTSIPVPKNIRGKIKFEDDGGNEYECNTEPNNFIARLFLNPISTEIYERPSQSQKPQDGCLKDKIGASVPFKSTIVYALSAGDLEFGQVYDYTAAGQLKVIPWRETITYDYVKPHNSLVLDSYTTKNLTRLKLQMT